MSAITDAPGLREATLRDLEALHALEQLGFSGDRLKRAQFRYLLGGTAHATVLVLDGAGLPPDLLGSAILLWREHASVARLYSLVVHPAQRGRGWGRLLLDECERRAIEHGCTRLSLEVRADNQRAIDLYQLHGFRVVEALPGYYEDGSAGLKMVLNLINKARAEVLLDVPYYAQTLDITCGPAALMMALKHFDRTLKLNRSLELKLWKEATTIFMSSGLGGCAPFGLAVAAQQRGYQVDLTLSSHRIPFISSVRSAEKKEVVRLVYRQQKAEALALGVGVTYRNFTIEDVTDALRRNAVPLVLTSTYRLHREKAPHWVVVTGYDAEHVYYHDPYDGYYKDDKLQARHVRLPMKEFLKIRRYGKDVTQSAVIVSRGRVPLA